MGLDRTFCVRFCRASLTKPWHPVVSLRVHTVRTRSSHCVTAYHHESSEPSRQKNLPHIIVAGVLATVKPV